jgi:hypothetical protein
LITYPVFSYCKYNDRTINNLYRYVLCVDYTEVASSSLFVFFRYKIHEDGFWRWSWTYSSWIYNYLCNWCLSPQKLWVRTLFMARCTWYNIMC